MQATIDRALADGLGALEAASDRNRLAERRELGHPAVRDLVKLLSAI